MWATVGDEFVLGYGQIAQELFATTIDAQQRAAASGIGYVPAVSMSRASTRRSARR